MASNPKVQVEISAETKSLMDGLNRATGAIQNATSQIEGQFGGLSKVVGNLTAPFAAIAAALGGGALFKGAVDGTVDLAKENGALSRALGITARESAILNTAIGDIHGNTEEFLGGAQKMVRTLSSNEAAIKGMGVATRDANGHLRSMPELLADINGKLLGFKEGTDRDAAAAAVFGRGWRDMLRYIQMTPDVMEEAARKVDSLGLSLGPDAAVKVKMYRAAMNDVDDALKGIKVRAGLEVLPALTSLGKWFSDIAPGGIKVVVGLLQTLGTVLSSRVVQLALLGSVLYMLRGTLASLAMPLAQVIDKIKIQMALGAMQGVTGVRAFGGALVSLVNPVTATIAVLGGAAWAIERWATAADRARKSFLDSLPSQTAQVKNAEQLAEKTKKLGEAMEKGNQTEAQKRTNQRQLQDVQNELIAMAPEYAEALKGEAKNYRDILAAIEKVNAQKRQELQLKRDSIAAELKAAEVSLARVEKEAAEPAKVMYGSMTSQDIEANQIASLPARLDSARSKAISLRQALAQADQALAKLNQDSKEEEKNRFGGGGGAPKSNVYAEELARLEKERAMVGANLNAQAKEEAEWRKLQADHEERLAKWTKDVKTGSLKPGEAKTLAAQSAALLEAQEKALRAKAAQEEDEQNQALFEIRRERKQAHQLALLDMDKADIQRRKELGQISESEALQQMDDLEEKRYQIEVQGLKDRLAVQTLEVKERAKIVSQLQALEDKRTAGREESGSQIAAAKRTENAQYTVKGGIKAQIRENQQALKQWGTFARGVMQGVETAFANGVKGILTGQMSLSQGIKAIWSGIVDTVIGALADIAAKYLVTAIANQIFGETTANSAQVQAGASEVAAAAGYFEAYAEIPYVGTALAMGAIAVMEASMAGMRAKAVVGAAEGGWFDKPTFAMIGEGKRPELVVPDTSFKDFAGNLTRNILAQERQAQGYQHQAAGFARASRGGTGGGPTVLHVHMDGVNILDSSRRGLLTLGNHILDATRAAAQSRGQRLVPGSVIGGI